jgi:hypothetical protein
MRVTNTVKLFIENSLLRNFLRFSLSHTDTQGRREGVKGVTVSRGPGLKKGPEISKTKEK